MAQAALIGEPAEISPEKAKWDGSKYTGGIAFERSRYAVSVEENSRTYTLAQSYQVQRNITGPCVGSKVQGQPSSHQLLRHQTIKASISHLTMNVT